MVLGLHVMFLDFWGKKSSEGQMRLLYKNAQNTIFFIAIFL